MHEASHRLRAGLGALAHRTRTISRGRRLFGHQPSSAISLLRLSDRRLRVPCTPNSTAIYCKTSAAYWARLAILRQVVSERRAGDVPSQNADCSSPSPQRTYVRMTPARRNCSPAAGVRLNQSANRGGCDARNCRHGLPAAAGRSSAQSRVARGCSQSHAAQTVASASRAYPIPINPRRLPHASVRQIVRDRTHRRSRDAITPAPCGEAMVGFKSLPISSRVLNYALILVLARSLSSLFCNRRAGAAAAKWTFWDLLPAPIDVAHGIAAAGPLSTSLDGACVA